MQTNSLMNDFFLSTFTTTGDPAAGANASIAVPDFAQIELVNLSFTLVTDANAANRVANIHILDSAIVLPIGSSAFAHTASLTFTYIAHQNPGFNAPGAISALFIPLPNLRIFDNTATIELTIDNIQVADQISNIRAHWKAWLGVSS